MTDFSGGADDVSGVEQGAAAQRAEIEARQAGELAAIVAAADADAVAAAAGAPGAAVAGDAEGPDNGELAGTVALVVFEVVAGRAGEHWRLSAVEAREFGRAAGAVLDKHLGRGAMGPEAALVAVALSLVLPRLMMTKAARRKESADVVEPAAAAVAAGAEPAVSAAAMVD